MTEARPTVRDLHDHLQQAYARLRQTLDQMPLHQADDGSWTATQVLAHVAFWDRYQTERLQRAIEGHSLPTEMDEQANAALENDARAAGEHRTHTELHQEATAARAALLDFVASLPDKRLHAHYEEGEWPLSLVQLIHQVGIWHVRAHTASLPGGAPYSGNPRDLDADYFPR